MGIQFYNKKAQISLPKWITDFKVNVLEEESNLNGFYATLKVKFNPDFFIWLNNSFNFLLFCFNLSPLTKCKLNYNQPFIFFT